MLRSDIVCLSSGSNRVISTDKGIPFTSSRDLGRFANPLRIFRDRRCTFLRQGNGDRENWYGPSTNRSFLDDRTSKFRHAANEVLKQAGIEKHF